MRHRKIAIVVTLLAAGSASAFLRNDPTGGTYFATQPPGAEIPRDDEECAREVRRHAWEPRPENVEANGTTPGDYRVPDLDPSGKEEFDNEYRPRVTGNFIGTTDEILQWGACKWGFDENIVRAQAMQESGWRQSANGDNGDSWGILQIRASVFPGTFPWTRDSTAFNVDFALAYRRACFEGFFDHWGMRGYRAGDEWGCLGLYYSGGWYDAGARDYIAKVKGYLAEKPWLAWGYPHES